jgi:hypothetical protein
MPILQNRLRTSVFSWIFICMVIAAFDATAFSATAAKTPVCKYHYYHESTEVNGHNTTTEYYVPDGSGGTTPSSLCSTAQPEPARFAATTSHRSTQIGDRRT